MSRRLKRGEYVPDSDESAQLAPDLVRVHHEDLGVTQVVRRGRLSQMDPGWEVVDAEELKGQALDDALEAVGLPKSGSAEEKRARLAEHEAAALAAASESNRDTAVTTTEQE